jgi:hypothetical protein
VSGFVGGFVTFGVRTAEGLSVLGWNDEMVQL